MGVRDHDSDQETKAPVESVVVARCDATAELSLSAQHGVSGYPSLRFFPLGSTLSEPYSGVGHSAEAISTWLIRRTGLVTKTYQEPPPLTVSLTTATFDSVAYDPDRTGELVIGRLSLRSLFPVCHSVLWMMCPIHIPIFPHSKHVTHVAVYFALSCGG
jgi:hypothetical protein